MQKDNNQEQENQMSQIEDGNGFSVALTAFHLLLFIVMIALLVSGTASNYIYAADLFFLVFSGCMFVNGTRSIIKTILNKLSAIESLLQQKQ